MNGGLLRRKIRSAKCAYFNLRRIPLAAAAILPNGKLAIATNLLFASLTKRVTDPSGTPNSSE